MLIIFSIFKNFLELPIQDYVMMTSIAFYFIKYKVSQFYYAVLVNDDEEGKISWHHHDKYEKHVVSR